MEDVQLARLKTIAERGWLRTLDDTLGIAHGERQRRTAQQVPGLPVWEPLLADRPHHIIPRQPREVLAVDNPWGFKLQQPKQDRKSDVAGKSVAVVGNLGGRRVLKTSTMTSS